MNGIDDYCAQDDVPDGTGWHFGRCSRKGKYEEGGKLWCKQHLPSNVASRRAAREAEWDRKHEAEMKRYRAVNAHKALVEALEAVEWVPVFDVRACADGRKACPACQKRPTEGHTPDCQLAAALRAAKGE